MEKEIRKGIKEEEIGLLDYRTSRPDDTEKLKYRTIGSIFSKELEKELINLGVEKLLNLQLMLMQHLLF